jgi:hypothetical protein
MATAIAIKDAKNVIIDNAFIRGFEKGIVVEDSSISLNRIIIAQNKIGLIAKGSFVTIKDSLFIDNEIDILAENASIDIIDSIAKSILLYFSNVKIVHYAINPYKIIAQAIEVLEEREPIAKKKKFKELLKTLLEYASIARMLYDLIKIILEALS